MHNGMALRLSLAPFQGATGKTRLGRAKPGGCITGYPLVSLREASLRRHPFHERTPGTDSTRPTNGRHAEDVALPWHQLLHQVAQLATHRGRHPHQLRSGYQLRALQRRPLPRMCP